MQNVQKTQTTEELYFVNFELLIPLAKEGSLIFVASHFGD